MLNHQAHAFLGTPTYTLNDSAPTIFPNLDHDSAQLLAMLWHYDICKCHVCYRRLVEKSGTQASTMTTSNRSLPEFSDTDRLFGNEVPWDILLGDDHALCDATEGDSTDEHAAESAKFWRRPLPPSSYDEETQQAWTEAKAFFGISAEEEPGNCARPDEDSPLSEIALPTFQIAASQRTRRDRGEGKGKEKEKVFPAKPPPVLEPSHHLSSRPSLHSLSLKSSSSANLSAISRYTFRRDTSQAAQMHHRGLPSLRKLSTHNRPTHTAEVLPDFLPGISTNREESNILYELPQQTPRHQRKALKGLSLE